MTYTGPNRDRKRYKCPACGFVAKDWGTFYAHRCAEVRGSPVRVSEILPGVISEITPLHQDSGGWDG